MARQPMSRRQKPSRESDGVHAAIGEGLRCGHVAGQSGDIEHPAAVGQKLAPARRVPAWVTLTPSMASAFSIPSITPPFFGVAG